MSIWLALVIGLIALGLIVGNILLLRESAKRPFPKVSKDNNANFDDDDEDKP